MKKFATILLSVLFFSSFLVAGIAMAATLSFDQVTDYGTVSYDGNGGALIGKGIQFDVVTATGTPQHAGSAFEILGGELNFSTGANVYESSDFWEFGAGGSFILTGTVMNGGDTVATGTLLSGSFSGKPRVIGSGDPVVDFGFIGFGVDQKNIDLIEYYGLDDINFTFASTSIAFGETFVNRYNNSFFATVTEADITNTSTSVPEPATMLLLGTGLIGLAGFKRRFKK